MVDGPGVLVGRKGTLGTVFFCDGPFWPHDTTLWVKDFHGNDPKFCYYFLKTMGFERFDCGASNPTLNRNHVHQITIHYPSVGAQRRVAAILSAYDDLIENNIRRIKILEEMAQMIYREWFVNFRFPGHQNVKMVESELGLIPDGWSTKFLADIAYVLRGRSYRSVELTETGGLPFVNLKCIARDGGFRRDGLKAYSGRFTNDQVAYPGDIVMAVTDMTQERRLVARSAKVPSLNVPFGIFSMDLVKIRPIPEVPVDYLYSMLRFSKFADEVKQHANGANVLHLNPRLIEQFRFACPPAPLRESYSGKVSSMNHACDVLEHVNDNLRKTRNFLLPKLISGEVSVDAAEDAALEAAV